MSGVTLYMAPGTCARVTAIALEEAGVEFESAVVRFMKGEHKSPAYLKLNPKGKVPALIINGEALTENVAILTYLAAKYPKAALMPATNDPLAKARQLSDLSYCASTLHPIVTRIRMPQVFAGPDAAGNVWQAGCEAMKEHAALVNTRLDGQAWWYGKEWSVMDGYLYWVFWRVAGAEFDMEPYPNIRAHMKHMEQRPAVQRALKREADAQAILEKEGLAFVPPKPVKPGSTNK